MAGGEKGEWKVIHTADNLGSQMMNQYFSKFEEVLEEYLNETLTNEVILNDAGEEWSPGSLIDWSDTSSGTEYFTEVAKIHDEAMDLLSSGDASRAQDFIDYINSPDARAAAQKLINEMLVAQRTGEAKITAGQYPDGSDIPIDDRISEDEDAAALNELANKQAEAANNLAKEDARASSGEPSANSVSFKEQCFLTSKIIDIIDYKEKTISKFKKIPYYPDAIQPNDFPSNASLMIHDDPFHFVNRLLLYTDTEEYFKMRSEEIANLQPQIRFFKSMYDPEDKVEKNVEIHFDTTFTSATEVGTAGAPKNTDLESLLSDKRKRNAGVGIKKFDISFIGTDPFAAKKDLRAKLVIYAASFDELFKIRGSNKSIPYRYIDLALKTQTVQNSKSGPTSGLSAAATKKNDANMTRAGTTTDDATRLDFTIKAKIGIKPPHKTVAYNTNLLAALRRNSVTVQMTPVTHEFNFNEDGTVEFVIHFVPFMHDHFNTSMFDVFSSTDSAVTDLSRKITNFVLDEACEAEIKEKFRTLSINERKSELPKHLRHLISRLYRKQQIHYLTLPATVVKLFNEKGPAADIREVFGKKREDSKDKKKKTKDEIKQAAKVKEAADEAKKIVLKNSFGGPVSVSENNVPFVYLHDIVDIALENVEKSLDMNNLDKAAEVAASARLQLRATSVGSRESINAAQDEIDSMLKSYRDSYREAGLRYKKFRVILGPIEIVDPANPQNVRIVSLGDIPVSLRYFQEFMTGQILSQGRTRFPISAFLTKLIGVMLKSFLNNDTCFGGAVKHKFRVGKTEALCYNDDLEYDDISRKIITARANALKAAGYKPKKTVKTKDFEQIPCVDRIMAEYMQQPILQTAGYGSNDLLDNSSSDKQYLYMIFFAARTNAIHKYVGDKEDDVKRGCHHYKIGRDEGIIKTIKLNRDKRPMMKEARFEASGYDGLQQMKEVYNVDVDCYANFNVFPGAKIYVDPEGWAPNMTAEAIAALGGSMDNLTDLGIGGYYDVTKVEHSFGPGEFNTSFTAYWTNGIGRSPPPAKKKPSKKEVTKCKVAKELKQSDMPGGSSENPDINAARSSAAATPAFLKTIAKSTGIPVAELSKLGSSQDSVLSKVTDLAKKMFSMNPNPSDAL